MQWNRCYIVGLMVTVLVLLVTMPVVFYPGDNFTPRAEAAYFLSTGEFGIPLDKQDELGEFVEQ
ncbi:MAG: hypothetical protein KDA84_03430, partial [Planctomycetaceae bacterium]|nr:hypothetical protein [Planctomycetaceae bacterium]